MRARIATSDDLELVTEIITAAFRTDPLWGHALSRPDGSTAHHSAYWRLFVAGALRYPDTWIAGDGEAVTIWLPPGAPELSPEGHDRLTALVPEILDPSGAERCFELLERFDAVLPHGREFSYLTLFATHPDHRGRGVGMSLLRENLARLDERGLPAYLESSNPANNARYARVGFEPLTTFEYPGGGPVVTTMWREPRQGI